jgi:hypothetical protein
VFVLVCANMSDRRQSNGARAGATAPIPAARKAVSSKARSTTTTPPQQAATRQVSRSSNPIDGQSGHACAQLTTRLPEHRRRLRSEDSSDSEGDEKRPCQGPTPLKYPQYHHITTPASPDSDDDEYTDMSETEIAGHRSPLPVRLTPASLVHNTTDTTTTPAAAPKAKGHPLIVCESLPNWTQHFKRLNEKLGHPPNARPYGKGIRFLPKTSE